MLTIRKAEPIHLEACVEALVRSELGRRYFSREGSARSAIEEAFSREEIQVAVDESGECAGFMQAIPNGIFHSFPYLHLLAVRENRRNGGVGRALMDAFEEEALRMRGKAFLVVADFNPDAKRFYERLGYVEVGAIPNLYRDGISEHLMMKVRQSVTE